MFDDFLCLIFYYLKIFLLNTEPRIKGKLYLRTYSAILRILGFPR